jgi:hypothetical protein
MFPRFIAPALILLFTAFVHPVIARSVNVGFQTTINTYAVDIFPSVLEETNNFRAARVLNYTFIVPITITRHSSPSNDLQLTLFTRPYDYDEDQPPQDVQVYAQPVFMNERNSYDVTAAFNLSTNSTEDAVHHLRAQLDIQV